MALNNKYDVKSKDLLVCRGCVVMSRSEAPALERALLDLKHSEVAELQTLSASQFADDVVENALNDLLGNRSCLTSLPSNTVDQILLRLVRDRPTD